MLDHIPGEFETDEDRSYFLTTLPIHPELNPQNTSKSIQSILENTQSILESTQFVLSYWPEALQKEIQSLGTRPAKQKLRNIIIALCSVQPLSAAELSIILSRRSKKTLVRDHLTAS